MAAGVSDAPALLPVRPNGIPAELRAHARWAPWRAVWNAKRGKWDKVPCSPSGYMLSTKRPEAWVSFETALAAYQATPGRFAGVGYLMTGEHGLVGVDLDRCVDAQGQIAPWARELLLQLGSTAELSPSGLGLRAWVRGEADFDWCNHEQGVEVYAGHTPRFLTATGCTVLGLQELRPAPAGVLEELAQRYAREREQATVISLAMPDLLDDLALPDVGALDVPPRTRDFLVDGTTGADRSRDLFTAAVDLFRAGLDVAAVLSLLAANPHAMAIALDHRRQDHDRALMYLWVEHTQKAQARAAASRAATADDFEDVTPAAGVAGSAAPATAPRPRSRFAPVPLIELLARPRPRWTIKRLLPEGGVGMVFGPSMSGKSFFVLDLCIAVARGAPWRGRTVKQGAVAYVLAEGAGGFPDRIRAHADCHGGDVEGLPLHVIPAAPNLLERADVKELATELRALAGLRLVVLDTLAQVTAGADENSSADMGRALRHAQTLAEVTGALVLLVGHTGKDEDKGPRGHSSQIAAFDVAIQLERDGDLRKATVRKMKDGPGEGEGHPFHLAVVVLGLDEDGEDITSCVVVEGDAAGAVRAPLVGLGRGQVQRAVMRVLVAAADLAGGMPHAGLIEAAIQELTPPESGKRDNRRGGVMRAIERMADEGAIICKNGMVTLPGGQP